MLDHMCIDVSNLEQAKQWYARALAPLHYRVVVEWERWVGFGVLVGEPDPSCNLYELTKADLWIAGGQKTTPRAHLAFRSPDRKTVEMFHRAALEAGGVDNGKPGLRPNYHPNYFAAYVLDPDGNNVEAVCHDPE
jgi:catechol 2,3-dioxygenase-like lactoylglutathione lyase family enzyme